MAQYSVLIIFTVSVLIAQSISFRVDLPVSIALEEEGRARQQADSILEVLQTTQAALPLRIRDTVLSQIRDFGDNVRQVPNRLSMCLQDITKCAQNILRRNATDEATDVAATTAATTGFNFPLVPLPPFPRVPIGP